MARPLLLAVHLGLFLGAGSLGLTEGEAVRICLATAGLWWGLFTLVTVSPLRDRPPVAAAHGAATSGFLAANALLERWGVRGQTLWTVPRAGRSALLRGLAALGAP